MIYLIAFIIGIYILQIAAVVFDLAMGYNGVFDKRTIKTLLIPFGFVVVLYRIYQERE